MAVIGKGFGLLGDAGGYISRKAKDLIDEISEFSDVDSDGFVSVFHRTSKENADKIRESGIFTPKEDGIFFSTKRGGANSDGYGDEVIELKIPADKLELDDIFDGEAHLRLPAKANKPNDVSEFIPNKPLPEPSGLLDMSTLSRMDRAKEQGYDIDTPYFHGSQDGRFEEFNRSGSGELGKGVYLSKEYKIADDYSRPQYGAPRPEHGDVKTVLVKGKMAEIDRQEYLDLRSKYMNQLQAENNGEWKGEFYNKAVDMTENYYKQQGYSGLSLNNPTLGQSHMYDQSVIFDPKNIRSTNAKFDPANADSSSLLASNPVATAAAGAGGILAMTASDDSEASFLGPLAAKANQAALAIAKKMDASNINPEKIWQDTGWGKGANGAWKFEISDANSIFSVPDKPQGTLGEYLDHPELYENYPDLKGTRFQMSDRSGAMYQPRNDLIDVGKGSLDLPNSDISSARGITQHEVQHAIQGREPTFSGGAEANTDISQLSVGEKTELEPFIESKRMYGNDEVARMSDIGDVEYINSLEKIVKSESPKLRSVTGQSDWYAYSDDIIETIGPIPKKAGRAKDEWVRGAAAFMRNRAKDNLNTDASMLLQMADSSPKEFSSMASKYKKLRTKHGEGAARYDSINDKYDSLYRDTPKNRYYASAGENEAYDVQGRLNMSAAARRGSLPLHMRREATAKQWSRALPTNPKALAASGLLASAQSQAGQASESEGLLSSIINSDFFSANDERSVEQSRMTPALMEYARRVEDWKSKGWILPDMPETSNGVQGLLSQISAVDQESLRRAKQGYVPTPQEQGLLNVTPIVDLLI